MCSFVCVSVSFRAVKDIWKWLEKHILDRQLMAYDVKCLYHDAISFCTIPNQKCLDHTEYSVHSFKHIVSFLYFLFSTFSLFNDKNQATRVVTASNVKPSRFLLLHRHIKLDNLLFFRSTYYFSPLLFEQYWINGWRLGVRTQDETTHLCLWKVEAKESHERTSSHIWVQVCIV